MNKIILSTLICICSFMLNSCGNTNNQLDRINTYNTNYESSHLSDYNIVDVDEVDMYQLFYDYGTKIKMLSENQNIDDTVIIINERIITRKDIEIEKLNVTYLKNGSLKERVRMLIQNTVLTAEANRLGIQPSDDKIMSYMKNIENAMDNDDGQIGGYLDGANISKEEYISTNRELAYNMYQREALWSKIKESMNTQIGSESDKRGVSFDEIEKEYYNRYVDELINNANIKFLDTEIESIFCGDGV